MAAPGDAAAAVAILREAAEWSGTIGARTWDPATFTEPEYRAHAEADELVGGWEGAAMVACMLLQRRDALWWPDDPPGSALYVHKLAVRRAAAGRGWSRAMIEWAAEEARASGAGALRLDTLADGPLPALYRVLGFREVDAEPITFEGRRFVRMERPVSRE